MKSCIGIFQSSARKRSQNNDGVLRGHIDGEKVNFHPTQQSGQKQRSHTQQYYNAGTTPRLQRLFALMVDGELVEDLHEDLDHDLGDRFGDVSEQ